MPRRVVPPGMSYDMAALVESVSSAVRTELLHRLSCLGPRSAVELADDLQVDHAVVHRHLVALEEAGMVERDHADPARRGRTKVQWSSRPAEIRTVAESWSRYAAGESGT